MAPITVIILVLAELLVLLRGKMETFLEAFLQFFSLIQLNPNRLPDCFLNQTPFPRTVPCWELLLAGGTTSHTAAGILSTSPFPIFL